jgi:predicted nuclease with TOPRIM domain
MKFKKEGVKRFNIPLEGHGWVYLPHYKVAKKAASALIRSADKIPQERQQVLKDTVSKFWEEYGREVKELEKEEAGESEREAETEAETEAEEDDWNTILEKCSLLEDHYRGPDFIEHGNSAIQQLTKNCVLNDKNQETWPDLEGFIREWRQHFLDNLKPKHLSELWTVDGDIYTR